MKRVISTKVDQAKHAEFLEYCAGVNKYPANAMRDALDLLLVKNNDSLTEAKPRTEIKVSPKQEVKPEPKIDEDEAELE